MKQKLFLFTTLLFLSSCSWMHTHKMDIEQGNIINESQVRKLHPGMSESTVKDIMGNPILINLFSPERMEYVYSYQPGYEPMQVTRLSCVFIRNRLKGCELSH